MFVLKSIMCVAKSCTLHKVTSKGSSRMSVLQGLRVLEAATTASFLISRKP